MLLSSQVGLIESFVKYEIFKLVHCNRLETYFELWFLVHIICLQEEEALNSITYFRAYLAHYLWMNCSCPLSSYTRCSILIVFFFSMHARSCFSSVTVYFINICRKIIVKGQETFCVFVEDET
jgi:hypothetical protein